MINALRQLAMVFVVTVVTMGMALSAGHAAMDLDCHMAQTSMSVDTPSGHAERVDTDHAHLGTVVPKEHKHGADLPSDSRDAHCKPNACSATAQLATADVAPAFLIGQTLDAIRIAPLVDLTIREQLRRPPRA